MVLDRVVGDLPLSQSLLKSGHFRVMLAFVVKNKEKVMSQSLLKSGHFREGVSFVMISNRREDKSQSLLKSGHFRGEKENEKGN
mgnify:CR=1 FL=1